MSERRHKAIKNNYLCGFARIIILKSLPVVFEDLNLNKPLLSALADLEYVNPTPIQAQAFPIIMSGRDVIGVAQTGTGKTFAYLLPLLRLLPFSDQPNPRILIIVPTRELVIQLVEEVEKLAKYMTVRVGGAYGGTNINTQKKMIAEGLDILVATPGRLLDLALTNVLRFNAISRLVIDEMDETLGLGFRPQLIRILDLLPEKRQNLLFSATLNDEVEDLIHDFFNGPVKVEVSPTGTPLAQIVQSAYAAPNFNTKANLLQYLLQTDASLSKVLVFVSTKKMADRLHELMSAQMPDQVGVIHSNKSQNYRIASVQQFDDGTHRVLIATDVIARGLDLSQVSHVINFDLPEVPEHYIHRIGRTGRADKAGIAIAFISERELEFQTAIEDLMSMPIPVHDLPAEVPISFELIIDEQSSPVNKNYLPAPSMNSQGAFHQKKAKNLKVNRAEEKRRARRLEKRNSSKRRK